MSQKSFISKMFGKSLVSEERNLESLDYDARDMIKGIVELSQTTVKEVMVPRIDVVFLSKDIALAEMFEMIINCGHSRFPVYEETIDNVIGILYAKDLLKYLTDRKDIEIEKILRKPYFIPESKRLDTLLHEFKRRHVHIAVSVDEYGGVSGIVCLEDIIEEIVSFDISPPLTIGSESFTPGISVLSISEALIEAKTIVGKQYEKTTIITRRIINLFLFGIIILI